MAQVQTDTSSFPLSLRPWPSQETDESLDTTISRIFEARGHFKNVTEQILLDEISQETPSVELQPNVARVGENEDELDPKARREKLYAAKTEMWQCLKYVPWQ